MKIDTTCPHCLKSAKSLWSKLGASPLQVSHCDECGKPIQLEIGPLHFVCAIAVMLPVMWLPGGWLRGAALIVLFLALIVVRAYLCRYIAHIEPITY